MGHDLSANSKLACVAGGMRERASGGAAIFQEFASGEAASLNPHLPQF